jgi:hypothetical protein
MLTRLTRGVPFVEAFSRQGSGVGVRVDVRQACVRSLC